MNDIAIIERFLWGLTMLLSTVLAGMVLWRKNYKAYPFFFTYILALLAQNLVFAVSYRIWGFGSVIGYKIAWGTQLVIVMIRALAAVEICRRILAKYPGIWALGQRIFLAMAILVLAYSWAVGGHSWRVAALSLDRGLELAMAASILALFLFIRYYHVGVEPADRLLAIGFFLFSWVVVLNDTIMERWLAPYSSLWNLVGTASFLVSMVLWTWALRHTQPRTAMEPKLLPADLYSSLTPEINARLKALSERLGHFWYPEGKKT